MNIKITADSTCDLSADLISRHNIGITPLYIIKGGISFRDGVDITPPDIFDYVNKGGALCSTAAINVADYSQFFSELSAEYDAVIHINLGSSLSTCYQNASIAADEFNNVYVIDSKNLSTGIGLVVLEAAKRAESGMDVQQIVEELNSLTSRVEASFVLDRLDYMVKGGRCSSVAALGANLLSLKPSIEVINGKMSVVKKYRGSFEKALSSYVRDRLSGRTDLEYEKIFLTHAYCTDKIVDLVRSCIRQYGDFSNIYETTAGCTISCHCGPGCLGILFIRK